MLVIKLVDKKLNKKFHLFKRRNISSIRKTDSFICCNEVFNVVEINEDFLKSSEAMEYLNRYSGAVICSKGLDKEDKLKRYLFDPTLYYSRAYLSSLTSCLKSEKAYDVCVYVDNFRFCREWVELANVCKTLILLGSANAELKRFCDFCRVELGLVPQVSDVALLSKKFLKINLNDINSSQENILLLKNGIETKLYPDARYFAENENVKKLKEYGIDKNIACAATQVVPFKKIYLGSD